MSGFLYRILLSTGSRIIGMKNTWLSIGWVMIIVRDTTRMKKSLHICYNFHKIIISVLWRGIRFRGIFLFSKFWSDCTTNMLLKKKWDHFVLDVNINAHFLYFLEISREVLLWGNSGLEQSHSAPVSACLLRQCLSAIFTGKSYFWFFIFDF